MAKILGMDDNMINEFITRHLPIREVERDKFGEVFTPHYLVEELLSEIPDKVWSDSSCKWLDPSAGVGNFGLLIYSKLMKTLTAEIPDTITRSKHIIENMLYHVELNPKNANKLKGIFGGKNVFNGSFLNDSEDDTNELMKRKFGVTEFDVIIGNPPYQRSLAACDKRGTNAGRQTLWDKFILAGFNILKPDGFLAFITPNSWRGLGKLTHLWEFMKNKRVHYLHIYGMRDGIRHFGASTRFDLFVVQNSRNNGNETRVIDELGNKLQMQLMDWPFFPNYYYDKIRSILTSETGGIPVIYDTFYHTQKTAKMRSKKSSVFKYPVVHNITLKGLGFWYSRDKKKVEPYHFSTPKVLLNFNQFQYPHNDYTGKYGMSQLTFAIPIRNKKHGDLIVKAINTPEFKEIIKATKWAAFQTDWRMFKYFKPDFYKLFLGTRIAKKTMKRKRNTGGISSKKNKKK